MKTIAIACVVGLVAAVSAAQAQAQDAKMSFFITSQGPGDGANLGGLAGADAHCQNLARAVGAGGKTWRAYLSTGKANARDRIGNGPWHNAKGLLIASNLAALHGDANPIGKQTALTEKGGMVNGRGDSPNQHDILTGSTPEGTVVAATLAESSHRSRRAPTNRPSGHLSDRRVRSLTEDGCSRLSRGAKRRWFDKPFTAQTDA